MVEEICVCHQDFRWLLEGRRGDPRVFSRMPWRTVTPYQQVQKELMGREGMGGMFSSTHVLFEAVV